MEQKLRVILFLPKDIGIIIPGPDTDDFNLSLLWAQIEAVRAPTRSELIPTFPSLTPAPSAEAVAAKSQSVWPYIIRAGGIIAGIALIAAAPRLWFIAIVLAGAAFKIASHRTDDSSVWRRRFLDVEEEWNRAIDQWERRSGFTKIESLKASLIEAKRAYEALASEQTERINRYQDERESLQRAKFLERFRIRDYKISGVGPAKLATLTSYGIETAADVTWDSVLAIAGFGPTNSKPLLEWQQQCARRFVYDPKPTAADQLELNKIKTDIQQRRQTLRQKLQLKAQQFGQAVQSCKTMFKQGDPELEALHARRKQIEADLTYIGIPLPPRPTRPTPQPATPRPAPTTFRYPNGPQTVHPPTASATPSCPQCGSLMVRRMARRGRRAGRGFWGCSRYPRCTGTRPI